MAVGDGRLALAAISGIALAILLIVRGRLHPFVALLCGAFVIGPLGGLSPGDTAKAVQKGAGDILGGTGLVVALGLALGTMLQLSNGAAGLARLMIGKFASHNVSLAPTPVPAVSENRRVPVWPALLVVLLPVLLIVAGPVEALLPPGLAPRVSWMSVASNPVLALLIACLAALPLLFGRRMGEPALQEAIWLETMKPAAAILLAIGAGGALKQMLVSTGF